MQTFVKFITQTGIRWHYKNACVRKLKQQVNHNNSMIVNETINIGLDPC